MAELKIKFGDSINMNNIQEVVVMANILDKDKFYMKYEDDDWMKKLDIDTELMKKEIEKFFQKGVKSQNLIVKEIRKNEIFKDIAIKDIVVIFKEIKDKNKGIELKEMNEAEKEIEKKLDYIFSDEKSEEKKKVVKIETKEIEEEKKKLEEATKIKIKSNKLGQAIELLESIGM